VRLDRDAVSAVELDEVQRRHQADHRRRTCLVAADLQRVLGGPLAVRVVDDPCGEPQHAALDRGQRIEVQVVRRGRGEVDRAHFDAAH
jgi:hypothetical protein